MSDTRQCNIMCCLLPAAQMPWVAFKSCTGHSCTDPNFRCPNRVVLQFAISKHLTTLQETLVDYMHNLLAYIKETEKIFLGPFSSGTKILSIGRVIFDKPHSVSLPYARCDKFLSIFWKKCVLGWEFTMLSSRKFIKVTHL